LSRMWLGEHGEAAYARLERSLRLGPDSGRALVTSDSVDVRREVQRRIARLLRVEVVRPRPDIVSSIHEVVAAAAEPVLVWVEAVASGEGDAEAWRQTHAALNMSRDDLDRVGALSLVLAGPSSLEAEVRTRAPDLMAVIRPVVALGRELEPSSLSWLHVSDLHVRAEDWQQQGMLDALVRDVPRLLGEREIDPDAVFVTGDVIDRGPTEAKVEGARRFLTRLCEVVGVDPRERLFMVAGNHDVDRRAISKIIENDQRALLSLRGAEFAKEVSERLRGDAGGRDGYGARLQAWCELTRELMGDARGMTPNQPWRTDILEVRGLRVGIASLCSVWMSGPDEDVEGRVVLGAWQLREALGELERGGGDVRIAAMHHPLGWVHGAERRDLRETLLSEFDVVLHGHEHEADGIAESRGRSSMVVLGAAAGHGGVEASGMLAARLDPRARSLTTHHFAWSKRDGGFWCADPTVAQAARWSVGVRRVVTPTGGRDRG